MSPRAPRRDAVRRVYRAFLRCYPASFRKRYGPDLLQAFDDRRGEPRFQGRLGGVRLLAFLFRDFVHSVPLMRPRGQPFSRLLMSDFLRDLRYSVRSLARTPVFTVAAILTLALGIGLNTATFSAVHGLLLRPLPGAEDPDELVQLYREWPGITYGSNSIPHYQDLRDRTGDVFENVSGWMFAPMSLASEGTSERIIGMLASANFFQTYGARMALGRPFLPEVESIGPGAHPVAVLSHSFWQSRFGGDPGVIGRTVTLNGRAFEIVGVAAEDFPGPMGIAAPPVFVPLMMQNVIDPSRNLITARGSNSMTVVARLRDGVTLQRAEEALDALLLQLREEYGGYENQLGTTLVLQSEAGIHPQFRGAQVAMSTVIMSVVGLLLLIACVNVANLFLARGRERRREMGIRLSLGAGRRRIVQQLLTESLVFSLLGAVAGLGLARLALHFTAVFRPPIDGPFAFDFRLDGVVLAFTLGVTLLAAVVFGLWPALQGARSDTVSAVKGESAAGPGRSRTADALVVAQMALSLVLLIGSGLFLRSLRTATEIDPGFDTPANLAMASMDPSLQGYDTARTVAFYDRLLDEVEGLPGATAAGLANYLPLGLSSSDQGVEIPGYEFGEGERSSLKYVWVSEGYLEAMGTELLEGRTFTRQDDADGPPVIIVNRRFAERFWPGEGALGKTVTTAGRDRAVIGVVETGKYQSLGEAPTEFMYLPFRERPLQGMTLVARATRSASEVIGEIRGIVRAADPDLPLYDVRTMEDHMGIALLPARLGGSVLGIFGGLGLLLAAVGIYGVMAYSVVRRRRELGIRTALGADRGSVVRMVLGEGLRLAGLGAVIGLVGAVGFGQLVAGLLYGVDPLDPATFVGLPLLLVAVAALAVYVPARRAARAEPMRVLKVD